MTSQVKGGSGCCCDVVDRMVSRLPTGITETGGYRTWQLMGMDRVKEGDLISAARRGNQMVYISKSFLDSRLKTPLLVVIKATLIGLKPPGDVIRRFRLGERCREGGMDDPRSGLAARE